MSPKLIIIVYFILIIFLLFALTYWLYYYNLAYECNTHPNYWCWHDWVCSEGDDKQSYPAQSMYGCFPNVKRGEDYCKDNPGALGCKCKTNNPDLGSQCSCEWAVGGQQSLGNCGIKYCSTPPASDFTNCEVN